MTLAVTLPRIGVSALALAQAIAPIALACAAMAVAVLAAQQWVSIDNPLLSLCKDAAIGASVYAATFWFGYREIVEETWAMLRDRDAPQAAATIA